MPAAHNSTVVVETSSSTVELVAVIVALLVGVAGPIVLWKNTNRTIRAEHDRLTNTLRAEDRRLQARLSFERSERDRAELREILDSISKYLYDISRSVQAAKQIAEGVAVDQSASVDPERVLERLNASRRKPTSLITQPSIRRNDCTGDSEITARKLYRRHMPQSPKCTLRGEELRAASLDTAIAERIDVALRDVWAAERQLSIEAFRFTRTWLPEPQVPREP